MFKEFLHHPQRIALRRVLLKIHLWLGVGLSIYMVLICLSGSAIVYRVDMDRYFGHRTLAVQPHGKRLTDDELTNAAKAAFAHLKELKVEVRAAEPGVATEIWLTAGRRRMEKLFDPYTGESLGDASVGEPALITWLVKFHGDLCAGSVGRYLNGLGAVLASVLVIAGAVIWWPGSRRWRESLQIRRTHNWRRLNWDIHSAFGFWMFVPLLMWCLTAIYLSYPRFFEDLAAAAAPHGIASKEWFAIEAVIASVVRLHFGRAYGEPAKLLWFIAGLVPVLMVFTGILQWWNRSLRRRWQRRGHDVVPTDVDLGAGIARTAGLGPGNAIAYSSQRKRQMATSRQTTAVPTSTNVG